MHYNFWMNKRNDQAKFYLNDYDSYRWYIFAFALNERFAIFSATAQ